MNIGDVYQVEIIDGAGLMRAKVVGKPTHPGGGCAPVKAPPGALDPTMISRCCAAHGDGPYTCCRCGTRWAGV